MSRSVSQAMFRHLLNIAGMLSAVVFWLIVMAWMTAGHVDPRKHFVSFGRDCHLSIDAWGAAARLEVFNDSYYGPYSGSIIGFSSAKSPAVDPNGPRVWAFGDTAGIYFRRFRWPSGKSLWTLSISLLYPLALSCILPIVWFTSRRRASRYGFPLQSSAPGKHQADPAPPAR